MKPPQRFVRSFLVDFLWKSPPLDPDFNRSFGPQAKSFPMIFQHEGMPYGIFLSWKLLILLNFDSALTWCAQEVFHFQQSKPKPKLNSSVTLTAENWLKQYLIKITWRSLPVNSQPYVCWGGATPLLVSFLSGMGTEAMLLYRSWVLLVLNDNHLTILTDSWCNYSKILHMWRTDTYSELS